MAPAVSNVCLGRHGGGSMSRYLLYSLIVSMGSLVYFTGDLTWARRAAADRRHEPMTGHLHLRRTDLNMYILT